MIMQTMGDKIKHEDELKNVIFELQKRWKNNKMLNNNYRSRDADDFVNKSRKETRKRS